MTDYFLIRTEDAEGDVNRPQPWPLVVDEDGNIISGRPDADQLLYFDTIEVGDEPVFVKHNNNGNPFSPAPQVFTVGTVITVIQPYLDPETIDERESVEQYRENAIQHLRDREAQYRAALSRAVAR